MNLPTSSKTASKIVVLLSLPIALAFSSCSSGTSVELQKPTTPPPSAPAQKPGQANQDGSPAAPGAPAPAPTPTPAPGPARYRLLCDTTENQFGSSLTTAHGVGGYFDLLLNHTLKPGQPLRKENPNLANLRNGMLVPSLVPDHLLLYFTAQSENRAMEYGPRRFYYCNVDALLRTGTAVDLGSVPSMSSSAQSLAHAIGLDPVNYGAGDKGSYVLLPGSGGLRILSPDRKKSYGNIGVGSSDVLFPKIFENEKLFSAIVGSRQILQQLEISADHVSVAKSIALGGGRATGPIQQLDSTSFAWAEATGSSSAITIARLDLKTSKVTRATYRTKIAGASIFPQAGFRNQDGETTIYVAVEKSTSRASEIGGSGRVDYAKIQLLSFDASGTALVEKGTLDYPDSVIERIMDHGRRNKFIIQSILTTWHAEDILASFDDHYGIEVYKDRGGYLDTVIEEDCVHPTLVEEKY